MQIYICSLLKNASKADRNMKILPSDQKAIFLLTLRTVKPKILISTKRKKKK